MKLWTLLFLCVSSLRALPFLEIIFPLFFFVFYCLLLSLDFHKICVSSKESALPVCTLPCPKLEVIPLLIAVRLEPVDQKTFQPCFLSPNFHELCIVHYSSALFVSVIALQLTHVRQKLGPYSTTTRGSLAKKR